MEMINSYSLCEKKAIIKTGMQCSGSSYNLTTQPVLVTLWMKVKTFFHVDGNLKADTFIRKEKS